MNVRVSYKGIDMEVDLQLDADGFCFESISLTNPKEISDLLSDDQVNEIKNLVMDELERIDSEVRAA